MLFSSFPYDYYVLWAEPPSNSTSLPLLGPATFANGTLRVPADPLREPYFALLEQHLRWVHASPPLIARILHLVIGTGLAGLLLKLYKPSEANMLFDGASLVLYLVGVVVYVSNIVQGLRIVSNGIYGDPASLSAEEAAAAVAEGHEPVGREDSLRVLAASNTILALVLIGVLILQAGEWYAARKEEQEISEMDRVQDEKRKRRAEGGSGAQVPGVPGSQGVGGDADKGTKKNK